MTGYADRLAGLDAAMHRFAEAWASGDIAVLDSLLSPNYTHTDAFGEFHDRSSWLEYAQRRTGRTTRIGFRSVRRRMVGDVAIVTGINDIHGPGAVSASDQRGFTIRFIQVWVWDRGRWVREAFQATPFDEASAPAH